MDLRTVLEFSWWVDSKTVLDFEIQRRIDWDIQGQRHGITSFLQNPQKLFYAMELFLINIYIFTVINNFKSPSGDLAEEQFILIYLNVSN